MRDILIAVLGYIALSLFLPSIWERFMNTAPDWVMRFVWFAGLLMCAALFVSAEPIYQRLTSPRQHVIATTAIMAILCAALGGTAWWIIFSTTFVGDRPRPRLIVDEDVGLTGQLPLGSNVYSVAMELTIRNVGTVDAQGIRVRMGGSPITRLHEFAAGLDTRLGNPLRAQGYFIQRFTMNETLRPDQLAAPDVTALGGAFALVLTHEDDRGTRHRDEQYLVCCRERQVRHASTEQREVLEPLVRAAFP